jgi:hypothetical protein
MTRDPSGGREKAVRALQAYNRTRGTLPRAAQVAVRPNVHRLASITRTRTASSSLNLARAVVAAGEEAWMLVAPALRGEREALKRLRELAAPGVEAARVARPGPAGAPTLPESACDGTEDQRTYLRTLITFVRETSGHGDALPGEVQLRISKRMTSSLGLCARAGDTHRVTIAERLFRPGLEDILLDTVRHEVAHLADQATSPNGRSSHGPRWKEWARRLGARPERLGPPEVSLRVARANGGRGWGPRRGADPGMPTFPDEVRRWLDSR